MGVSQEHGALCPRALISITSPADGDKLQELFDSLQLPLSYRVRGKGTASSEMLDIFGLGGTTRLISVSFVPRDRAKELLSLMNERLFYRHRGGGIAFTVPVTGIQNPVYQVLSEEASTQMNNQESNTPAAVENKAEYSVIWASVEAGFCDEVVDAARAAGARGGTILHGLRHASEAASHTLGITVQAEQECILIVTPKENKMAVMSAVSTACGLGTAAHGTVIALPVEDAIGLA